MTSEEASERPDLFYLRGTGTNHLILAEVNDNDDEFSFQCLFKLKDSFKDP